MTPNQIRSEIDSFIAELLGKGLAIDTNPPIIREEPNIVHVVWSSAPKIGYDSFALPFATIAEYRKLLDDRQYNFLLLDGSFIQARYLFQHGDLIKHNLTYYPCPVQIKQDDISEGVFIGEVVDQYLLQFFDDKEWLDFIKSDTTTAEMNQGWDDIDTHPRFQMKSPVRFDYDVNARGELHPASHVHISDPDCRMPVHAPLSFGHFIRFIFKNFYRSYWIENEFIRNWPLRDQNRTISREEESELFFECRMMQ